MQFVVAPLATALVNTQMPFGTRWVLGGGNSRDFHANAEAVFALWDVQIREKQLREAVLTPRRLARDFPDNEEVRRFLQKHDTNGTPYDANEELNP
jgi:hypothetical protein